MRIDFSLNLSVTGNTLLRERISERAENIALHDIYRKNISSGLQYILKWRRNSWRYEASHYSDNVHTLIHGPSFFNQTNASEFLKKILKKSFLDTTFQVIYVTCLHPHHILLPIFWCRYTSQHIWLSWSYHIRFV